MPQPRSSSLNLADVMRWSARHGYPYSLLARPKLSGAHTPVAIPDGAVHEVLGPSEKRRAVIFSTVAGQPAVQISPVQFTPGQMTGFVVSPGLLPLLFRYEDYGSLVQGSWFACTNAGPAPLNVTECFETYHD